MCRSVADALEGVLGLLGVFYRQLPKQAHTLIHKLPLIVYNVAALGVQVYLLRLFLDSVLASIITDVQQKDSYGTVMALSSASYLMPTLWRNCSEAVQALKEIGVEIILDSYEIYGVSSLWGPMDSFLTKGAHIQHMFRQTCVHAFNREKMVPQYDLWSKGWTVTVIPHPMEGWMFPSILGYGSILSCFLYKAMYKYVYYKAAKAINKYVYYNAAS